MKSIRKFSALMVPVFFSMLAACGAAPGDAESNGDTAADSAKPPVPADQKAATVVPSSAPAPQDNGPDPSKPKATNAPEKQVQDIIIPIPPSVWFTSATHTLAVGSSATLTASADRDITRTPYYIEIYDTTAGYLVKSCGSGSSCTATVSQSAVTTHEYAVYLTDGYTKAYPPTNSVVSDTQFFVTWSNLSYTVSVDGPSDCWSNEPSTISATANVDVGPTPYYIEIFNANSSTRVAVCPYGTTCSVDMMCGGSYVAFISSASTAMPPQNAQASSAKLYQIEHPK